MYKINSPWTFVLCLLVLMVLGQAESVKAFVVPVTLDQLANKAHAIVRGKVQATKSEWNDEKNFIWTFVTVAVSDSIKGPGLKGKNIQIRVPNGVVGDIRQTSSVEVTFQVGEQVVLFLGKVTYKRKEFFSLIAPQGKFIIAGGKVNGKPVEIL